MSGFLLNPSRFTVGGAFTPSSLPSLVLHFDETSHVGSVTGWTNLAGSDDMTSVSTPTAGTQNGLATVQFDGTADYMALDGTATIATQPYTVAFGVKNDTRVGDEHLADWPNASRVLLSGDANWRIYAGGGVVDSGDTGDTSWHVLVVIFNGASSSIRLDGVEIGTGNPGTNSLKGGWRIGQGGGAAFTHCTFGEIVVDDSALSGTDLSDLETYLERWV